MASAAGFAGLVAAGYLDEGARDPRLLMLGIGGVVVVSLIVGVTLAAWLDQGIVGRLRGLLRGVVSGRIETHRGSPVGADWGELRALTQRLQSLLSRHRQLAAKGEELHDLTRQVATMRTAIEQWTETERWDALPKTEGALDPVVEALNHGLARHGDVLAQNRDAANQIRDDLAGAADDAHETSSLAERGFVDATALLTTVRELQRLGDELDRALDAAAENAAGDQAGAFDAWRTSAVSAIEELIAAAGQSVDRLAQGLMRVEEIAAQVNLLANRATLISLNVVVGASRAETAEGGQARLSEELKQLVHEVQAATQRVDDLSQAIAQDVEEASERMRGVRERVALRLEGEPERRATGPVGERQDTRRLLARVREMVQDATQKSERLSSMGERASRAAARLARELEDEVRDLEGLVVRLTPPEQTEPTTEPNTESTPSAEEPSDPIAFAEDPKDERRQQGERP